MSQNQHINTSDAHRDGNMGYDPMNRGQSRPGPPQQGRSHQGPFYQDPFHQQPFHEGSRYQGTPLQGPHHQGSIYGQPGQSHTPVTYYINQRPPNAVGIPPLLGPHPNTMQTPKEQPTIIVNVVHQGREEDYYPNKRNQYDFGDQSRNTFDDEYGEHNPNLQYGLGNEPNAANCNNLSYRRGEMRPDGSSYGGRGARGGRGIRPRNDDRRERFGGEMPGRLDEPWNDDRRERFDQRGLGPGNADRRERFDQRGMGPGNGDRRERFDQRGEMPRRGMRPGNGDRRENFGREMLGRHMEPLHDGRKEGFDHTDEMPRRGTSRGRFGRGRRPWRGRGNGRNQGERYGMYTKPVMGENGERGSAEAFGGLMERTTSEVSLCSTATAGEWEDIKDDSSDTDTSEPMQDSQSHRDAGRQPRSRIRKSRKPSSMDSKPNPPQLIQSTKGNVISNTVDDKRSNDSESEDVTVGGSESEDLDNSSESVSGDENKVTHRVRPSNKHKRVISRNDPKRFSKGKGGRLMGGKQNRFGKTSVVARPKQKSVMVPLMESDGQKSSGTCNATQSSASREQGPEVVDLLANLQNLSTAKITKEGSDEVVQKKPEVDEEGRVMNIFNFLLQHHNGRAEFSKIIKKRDLFPDGVDAVSWFKKHRDKFLLFENKGEVKFVSVFWKSVCLCNRYNKNDCQNEDCKFLHICMHYITGGCKYQNCLSHNFFDKRNNARSQELGFSAFKNKQIAMIVRCCIPEVCMDYQNRRCMHENDCPMIHVCRKKFCNQQCGDEHDIKGSEHNLWVLNIFHCSHFKEGALHSTVLHKKLNVKQIEQKKQQNELEKSNASLDQANDNKADNVKAKKRVKKSKPVQCTESFQLDHEQRENILEEPVGTENSNSSVQDNTERHLFEVASRPIPKPRVRSKPNLKIDTDKEEDRSSGLEASSPRLISFSDDESTKVVDEVEVVQDEDDTSGNFLCEKYVWSQCSKRSHVHGISRLPYQWQIRMHDGWICFEATQNELIEHAFCNLQKRIGGIQVSECCMAIIKFDSLEALLYLQQSDGDDIPGESVEVQRLSTPSYIRGKDGGMAELTQWCWYVKDDSKWIPYESGNLQYTLEMKYESGQSTYLLEREPFQYEINFSEMKETNMKTFKKTPIIRPMFVSPADVEKQNIVFHPNLLREQPAQSLTVPEGWAPLDCHQTVELVKLHLGATAEDEEVQNSFFSTMDRSKFKIMSLFRIQNPSMWEKYCSMKRTMEMALRREGIVGPVNEKRLFHGTQDDVRVIRGICHNNVDFRLCGKNATVFGEGAYFASDAKYSNSYATGLVQFMFVCKVLVGQYTKGDSTYRRPPARVGHTLYDSCVNNTADPIVYVVFDIAQCYPEFLIEYINVAQSPDTSAYVVPSSSPVTSMQASSSTSMSNPVTNLPPYPSATSMQASSSTSKSNPVTNLQPYPSTTSMQTSSSTSKSIPVTNLPPYPSTTSMQASSSTSKSNPVTNLQPYPSTTSMQASSSSSKSNPVTNLPPYLSATSMQASSSTSKFIPVTNLQPYPSTTSMQASSSTSKSIPVTNLPPYPSTTSMQASSSTSKSNPVTNLQPYPSTTSMQASSSTSKSNPVTNLPPYLSATSMQASSSTSKFIPVTNLQPYPSTTSMQASSSTSKSIPVTNLPPYPSTTSMQASSSTSKSNPVTNLQPYPSTTSMQTSSSTSKSIPVTNLPPYPSTTSMQASSSTSKSNPVTNLQPYPSTTSMQASSSTSKSNPVTNLPPYLSATSMQASSSTSKFIPVTNLQPYPSTTSMQASSSTSKSIPVTNLPPYPSTTSMQASSSTSKSNPVTNLQPYPSTTSMQASSSTSKSNPVTNLPPYLSATSMQASSSTSKFIPVTNLQPYPSTTSMQASSSTSKSIPVTNLPPYPSTTSMQASSSTSKSNPVTNLQPYPSTTSMQASSSTSKSNPVTNLPPYLSATSMQASSSTSKFIPVTNLQPYPSTTSMQASSSTWKSIPVTNLPPYPSATSMQASSSTSKSNPVTNLPPYPSTTSMQASSSTSKSNPVTNLPPYPSATLSRYIATNIQAISSTSKSNPVTNLPTYSSAAFSPYPATSIQASQMNSSPNLATSSATSRPIVNAYPHFFKLQDKEPSSS